MTAQDQKSSAPEADPTRSGHRCYYSHPLAQQVTAESGLIWPPDKPAMPIFDYRCEACGHGFDVLQKLGADSLSECPECGEEALKKLLSAPAFHLKGKGWRNSDDTPKKPDIRPRYVHTLDSPTPHAEHTHDPAPVNHEKKEGRSGMDKIVRDHVDSHSHSHGSDKGGHDHGHRHSHGKGSHDH